MDDNKRSSRYRLSFEKEVLVLQMEQNFETCTDFKRSVMESGLDTFSGNERMLRLLFSV